MLTPLSTAAPPILGENGYILEGLMATLDAEGAPHFAPMGPLVDERLERLWLRPFRTSTTFLNLKRTGGGVFHVTDDVEQIALAAIGRMIQSPRLMPAKQVPGVILTTACRWYEFEIESIDDSSERAAMTARVVHHGVLREFCGFNRAKHAVVEAAILATRVHLLDAATLEAEFARLAILVEKTGAAAEHRAFGLLRRHVHDALRAGSVAP